MAEVTTNQIKEMIDQLAAMTAAASITPEIVASIFEKMRNLNDQEREKVIKVATEYIEEIRQTGVDAEKCRTNNGSNVQVELDTLRSEMGGVHDESITSEVEWIDEEGNVGMRLSKGNLETPNWSSKSTPQTSDINYSSNKNDKEPIFAISDKKGNHVFEIGKDGKPRTAKWDGADQTTKKITINNVTGTPNSKGEINITIPVGEGGGSTSVSKESVIPNHTYYFEVSINYKPFPKDSVDKNSSSAVIARENIDGYEEQKVPCAVIFPNSYTPNGKPTQMVVVFHGASGLVYKYSSPKTDAYGNTHEAPLGYGMTGGADTDMGSDYYERFVKKFLDEGYALFDVNGYGMSHATNMSENDPNVGYHRQPYGSPRAMEATHRAFEYLKRTYNICDKLFVEGFSMGGSSMWSYGYMYPNDVAVCAGVAPTDGLGSAQVEPYYEADGAFSPRGLRVAYAFGYNSYQEMIDDNYQRLVGYFPPFTTKRYINGAFTPISDWNVFNVMNGGTEGTLYTPSNERWEMFFPHPIKIWHGTKDGNVFHDRSVNIVKALRNGGCNAHLRLVANASHHLITDTTYVTEEIVLWFNRFRD